MSETLEAFVGIVDPDDDRRELTHRRVPVPISIDPQGRVKVEVDWRDTAPILRTTLRANLVFFKAAEGPDSHAEFPLESPMLGRSVRLESNEAVAAKKAKRTALPTPPRLEACPVCGAKAERERDGLYVFECDATVGYSQETGRLFPLEGCPIPLRRALDLTNDLNEALK